mmetsp:Transcript_273/g.279  ORF Transcript_273/g.279 Transcript_273/m.279 type:complete len:81 (-) Transcript_273:853-1095(-)
MVSPETRSCLRKMKQGATLGAAIGVTFGAVAGGYEAFRYKGIPVSQKVGLALRSSFAGAIGFGFFLAVGTAIRGCGNPTY